MHNIRKIKKKRKTSKPLNSEQSAQEKLFQISRFEEELPFNEADAFAEKMQYKTQAHQPKISTNHRIIKQHNNLTQFVNNFQKKTNLNKTFSSFRKYRSQSQELSERKPISLITYMLIDKREDRKKMQLKRKFDSLINIKRKYTPKKNRSQECHQHQLVEMLNPQERLVALITGSNENASPIRMKNSKFFNKSSGFSGR